MPLITQALCIGRRTRLRVRRAGAPARMESRGSGERALLGGLPRRRSSSACGVVQRPRELLPLLGGVALALSCLLLALLCRATARMSSGGPVAPAAVPPPSAAVQLLLTAALRGLAKDAGTPEKEQADIVALSAEHLHAQGAMDEPEAASADPLAAAAASAEQADLASRKPPVACRGRNMACHAALAAGVWSAPLGRSGPLTRRPIGRSTLVPHRTAVDDATRDLAARAADAVGRLRSKTARLIYYHVRGMGDCSLCWPCTTALVLPHRPACGMPGSPPPRAARALPQSCPTPPPCRCTRAAAAACARRW